MQWILIIGALILAIPTYGISIIVLLMLLPMFGAKSRREIMPPLIKKSLLENEIIIVEDIFYEAAEKYAKEHRGEPVNGGGIMFYTLVDNIKVLVIFGRTPQGGVYIDAKDIQKEEKKWRDEFLKPEETLDEALDSNDNAEVDNSVNKNGIDEKKRKEEAFQKELDEIPF
jgi:hypothetical protein